MNTATTPFFIATVEPSGQQCDAWPEQPLLLSLEQGVLTSPGNLAFDASLRAQNSQWGLRALEDVARQAEAAGLHLSERHAMPANNLLLVWRRSR